MLRRRVKEVCVDCNGGWMSRLEKAAKPILEKLLFGPPQPLSLQEIQLFKRWAIKTAMVRALLDGTYSTFPFEHRKIMMQEKYPASWSVWLATSAYAGVFDRNWGVKLTSGPLEVGFQQTTFEIGPMCFSVFFVGDRDVFRATQQGMRDLSARPGFPIREVHPALGIPPWRTEVIMHENVIELGEWLRVVLSSDRYHFPALPDFESAYRHRKSPEKQRRCE
jgi:hypothetical protein